MPGLKKSGGSRGGAAPPAGGVGGGRSPPPFANGSNTENWFGLVFLGLASFVLQKATEKTPKCEN